MIKSTIEKLIRQTKNDRFSFDQNLDSSVIFEFVCFYVFAFLRSFIVSLGCKRKFFLFVGRQVSFFSRKRITLGNFVILGDNVYISGLGVRGVHISDRVRIGSFSQIVTSMSLSKVGDGIDIEENVGIGEFAYLGGAGGLRIGRDTIIGQYFSAHPENHEFVQRDVLIRNQEVTRQGIKIGRNCWIGSKVTILDGVTIGNGCVIAAGSVVNSSFPDNMVIAGVPAREIRTLS